MDKNLEVKISDFGFAKYFFENKKLNQTNIGTPLTMAPEVILGEKYNAKCDM